MDKRLILASPSNSSDSLLRINNPIMPLDVLPDYTTFRELEGCKGAINALLFSADGKLLLSGGDDERVRVWNAVTFKNEITVNHEKWAQITTLAWVYIDTPVDDKCTLLAVGTGRGNIAICPITKVSPFISLKEAMTSAVFEFNDAVEAMAYDRTNSMLAVTSHSGVIKMYSVDKTTVTHKWTASMKNAIPRSIFFLGPANSQLLSLGLETGEICCRESDSSQVLWRKNLDGAIGNAALSTDYSTLLVDNLVNGSFDVYLLPSAAQPVSLAFSAKRRYPKQCIFSENARIAVCGSTTNKVYVIDVTSSDIVQTLIGGNGDAMLQTVAATPGNRNGALIAGGSSTGMIHLWKRMAPKEKDDRSSAKAENPAQQQMTNISANPDAINPQLLVLVLILTWSSWYPRVSQFIAFGNDILLFSVHYLRTFFNL